MTDENSIRDAASVPIAPGDRSAHVRAAIRDAAVGLFSERGYVATGVRDIAKAAGTDPSIVIRHFGSKEALFVQTMSLPASWREALQGPVDDLGRSIVDLVAQRRDNGFGLWSALVRASDRPDVGRVYQASVTAVFAEGLASRLEGDDARVRAHLFAAQVEGLLLALSVRHDPVLLGLPHDELVERYGSILQATLTGP